jgi:hypothetical protein
VPADVEIVDVRVPIGADGRVRVRHSRTIMVQSWTPPAMPART